MRDVFEIAKIPASFKAAYASAMSCLVDAVRT
jgi:hypothetical protein